MMPVYGRIGYELMTSTLANFAPFAAAEQPAMTVSLGM
jgi:hypothetical protein